MGEHQHRNGIAAISPVAPPYKLQRIDGIALASHWQWIKSKLEIIQHKCTVALKRRGMDDIPQPLPEQIKQIILNGMSINGQPPRNQIEAYFVLDQKGVIRGFLTFNCPFNEFYQTQLTMYVWHAWGEPGVMAAVEPMIDKIAFDERGLLEIIHESPRLEWAERHRNDGYKLARMVWRKAL